MKQKLRGDIQQRDYEEANREYTLDIEMIEDQLSLAHSNVTTLDAFVRFAELMLTNIAGAWQKASAEQRQRVQNLLFTNGISYSMEKGFLNRANPSLFNMLEEISTEKGMLASPTGFEPVLPP